MLYYFVNIFFIKCSFILMYLYCAYKMIFLLNYAILKELHKTCEAKISYYAEYYIWIMHHFLALPHAILKGKNSICMKFCVAHI